MTSRRQFLAGLAALSLPRPAWAEAGSPAYLAAAATASGHVLHGLSAAGATVFAIPLPGRGHAAAAHPTAALAVAFARRPGSFALVIDCARGAEAARLTPPQGRQFNGHGAFSADGTRLYTSEVVAKTSAGRIGLWDTATWARLAEWETRGLGPHDIRLWGDGGLIVANGGIATDPSDRRKLNIATMRPSLVHLSADGEVLDEATLPDLPQASIRHLAPGPGGQIAFAMQWEGDSAETVPLLGLWQPGAVPVLCPAADADGPRMRGYAGSIGWSVDGLIALTSAKGGVVQIHAADGTFVATHARSDISGIAALDGAGFLATDGTGRLSRVTAEGITPLAATAVQWDNHLVALLTSAA